MPDTQLDIYMAGKRTLDARNRDVIRQRNFLSVLSLLSLSAVVVLSASHFRESSNTHYTPYIIEKDTSGRILGTKVLREAQLNTNTVAIELCRWVQDWRMVTTDFQAQKALVGSVFSMVEDNSEARSWILNWYRVHDPRERMKTQHVEATVKNVLSQSPNTYEVFWEERETGLNAMTPSQVSRWRMIITVAINPASQSLLDHGGLYIQRVTEPQREAI